MVRPRSAVKRDSTRCSDRRCPRCGDSRSQTLPTVLDRGFDARFGRDVGASCTEADAHRMSIVNHYDDGSPMRYLVFCPTCEVVFELIPILDEHRANGFSDFFRKLECRAGINPAFNQRPITFRVDGIISKVCNRWFFPREVVEFFGRMRWHV